MRKLIALSIVSALIGVAGCEMKSGTAPSTDPNNPNATRKLTATASSDHTITQGETDKVTVTVNRSNFKDDVTVEVSDLPEGVTLESRDMNIPADQNTITLTLKAAADATTTTDHLFQIVAKSKDIKSEPLNVKLTVKAK
jgi:hypothetical protein